MSDFKMTGPPPREVTPLQLRQRCVLTLMMELRTEGVTTLAQAILLLILADSDEEGFSTYRVLKIFNLQHPNEGLTKGKLAQLGESLADKGLIRFGLRPGKKGIKDRYFLSEKCRTYMWHLDK